LEARNRPIKDWYGKVQRGEIKLPRFQRFEAWDKHRIGSLLETIIHNLPLGITLVLNVGETEKFVSRYLQTAPESDGKIHEHLLDGQQRLTALWRLFHNNYQWNTFYVYIKEFDRYDNDAEREDLTVFSRGRYIKQTTGQRYPLWCDIPKRCLERGFIPTNLLKPESIHEDSKDWVSKALQKPSAEAGMEALDSFYEYREQVNDKIQSLRSTIANYNLPYLSLPAHTDKTVALNVFINMNTNSKPLSTYDIIVAEVESAMGQSLHDLEAALHQKHPEISRYAPLSNLVLTTSALLQSYLPNQRGAWDMDKAEMVRKWGTLERGLHQMAQFLRNEGIYDEHRLPTNAVLAVIAALYADIPDGGDKRGQDELLLKQYLWYACFSDRYESAASTYAYTDFNALKRIIKGEKKADGTPYTTADVPLFANHSIIDVEELMTADWPKRNTIHGRAILAVVSRLGALDFAMNEQLSADNIIKRQYHHIYPDALLKEAGIDSFLALNCALITGKTNRNIGRKDPLKYLKERYEWVSEDVVRDRLHSHLIPIDELANGGYEKLSEEDKNAKLHRDFEKFIEQRAKLVMIAVRKLVEGRQLSAAEIYLEATQAASGST